MPSDHQEAATCPFEVWQPHHDLVRAVLWPCGVYDELRRVVGDRTTDLLSEPPAGSDAGTTADSDHCSGHGGQQAGAEPDPRGTLDRSQNQPVALATRPAPTTAVLRSGAGLAPRTPGRWATTGTWKPATRPSRGSAAITLLSTRTASPTGSAAARPPSAVYRAAAAPVATRHRGAIAVPSSRRSGRRHRATVRSAQPNRARLRHTKATSRA